MRQKAKGRRDNPVREEEYDTVIVGTSDLVVEYSK